MSRALGGAARSPLGAALSSPLGALTGATKRLLWWPFDDAGYPYVNRSKDETNWAQYAKPISSAYYHDAVGNIVVSATQSGIYRSTNGGISFVQVSSLGPRNYLGYMGGGYWFAIKPVIGTYPLQGYVYGSSDNGITWTTLATFASSGGLLYASICGGAYVVGVTQDVFGMQFIRRSSDYGATWTAAATVTIDGATVNYISGIHNLGTSGVLLAFYQCNSPSKFGIMRSSDYGATWAKVLDTGVLGYTNFNCIGGDDSLAYVRAVNAFTASKSWVSTDAGLTWTGRAVEGPLEGAAHVVTTPNSLLQHYYRIGDGYTSSSTKYYGIKRSTDQGATWSTVLGLFSTTGPYYTGAFAPRNGLVDLLW